MNFGNSAEETAPPRPHTPRPEPDATQTKVESLKTAIKNGNSILFQKILDDDNPAAGGDGFLSSDVLTQCRVLSYAVAKLKPEIVKILLNSDCKPDIDPVNKYGQTLLSSAIAGCRPMSSSARYEIIDLLITNGANTEFLTLSRIDQWSRVVSRNDLSLAKLFVKHRIDSNEDNRTGMTLIEDAIMSDKYEMVDLLIKSKSHVNSFPDEPADHVPLRLALMKVHHRYHTPETIKIVKSIVAAGAKITSKEIDLCRGNYDVMNILAGGNIDTQDHSGNTAHKKILFDMQYQNYQPTLSIRPETVKETFGAGRFNLAKILLESLEHPETRDAYISDSMKTAAENGKYLELDALQELGGVLDAEPHAETETTAGEIVKDAQKETSKTPSNEEISNKSAAKIYPAEIALQRFLSEELQQHELDSEEYCTKIREADKHKLKTTVDKALFTALNAAEQSPSHLEIVVLAKMHFLNLNPAIDDAPPTTDEPYAIETAKPQAHADSIEPRATEEHVDADLIGNMAEY